MGLQSRFGCHKKWRVSGKALKCLTRAVSTMSVNRQQLPLSAPNTASTALNMKDSGLRIRVQRQLRDRFLGACRAQDKPAAQVIRGHCLTALEARGTLPSPVAKRMTKI